MTKTTAKSKKTGWAMQVSRRFGASRLCRFCRFCLFLLLPLSLFAADETKEVHVIEEKLVGGVTTQLRDQTLLTGGDYTTQMAPAISGQIFTHWSISRTQAFVNRDRLGRAKDSVTYHLYEPTTLTANYRPQAEDTDNDGVVDGYEIYWYGDLDETANSDTDGDGMTFAEELAAGTNPLIPNDSVAGGIVWDDGAYLETDLQVYEQAQGAVVGERLEEIFTSPTAGNEATSETFGLGLQPIVADVNDDGLWDLVLASANSVEVLVNVGGKGTPSFRRGESTLALVSGVDLAMNSTNKLATFTLDTPALGALSATTNGAALLVSDADGRIWYYKAVGTDDQLPTTSYQLQHKVWGGSFAGFAQGLRIAAVDWDDDGDLDCLCGTADAVLKGDLNGNGKLDNADYQALREMLKKQ